MAVYGAFVGYRVMKWQNWKEIGKGRRTSQFNIQWSDFGNFDALLPPQPNPSPPHLGLLSNHVMDHDGFGWDS